METIEPSAEELKNMSGFVTVEAPPTKIYKCSIGHEVSVGWASYPLYFSVLQDGKGLGTTNYLCGECIIRFMNQNFTMEEVKSDV